MQQGVVDHAERVAATAHGMHLLPVLLNGWGQTWTPGAVWCRHSGCFELCRL